jgi:ankyrin repeat protein
LIRQASALHCFAAFGDLETCRLLLESKADVNSKDSMYVRPSVMFFLLCSGILFLLEPN